MRYAIIAAIFAFASCSEKCECGIITDTTAFISDANGRTFLFQLENDCGTEWVEVDELTWLEHGPGMKLCP